MLTARLNLREPEPGDAPAIHAYLTRNADRFARWHHGPGPAGFDEWIASFVVRDRSSRHWLVLERDATAAGVLGIIGLEAFSTEPERSASISYAIDLSREGIGLAREAVEAIVAYAFDDLELDALAAQFHPENERSARLLAHFGFVVIAALSTVPQGFEGRIRPHALARLARAR